MPVTTTSAPKQLSDGNSVGTILGQSASDVIGFYGAAAGVAQPSGNAQAALARGQAAGSVGTFASTQSPPAVSTATAVEYAMTVVAPTTAVWKVAAGDFVVVIKPTAQAGLGIGNVRVSGANSIAINFSNFTGATVTPTSAQSYAVVALRGVGQFAATLSPASVAANSVVEQQFPVTGVRAGNLTLVSKPTGQTGLDVVGARAVSDGVLGITFANIGAVSLTPTAAEGYSVVSLTGMDALSNMLVAQAPVGTLVGLGSTNSAAASEQAVTLTGLTASDTVMGISKPTAQSGLGISGYRVSGANSLGITFGAFGISTTPTAGEVYGVSLFRPSPTAPLVLYNAALVPAAVSSNTTAEQTFTVAGLLSGTPVAVNKPSWTNGIGIVGARVSASNTLAINFCNGTGSAITPPAETYIVGNFQMPIPDTNASWVQPAAVALQNSASQGNALRSALVNLGLIAGS